MTLALIRMLYSLFVNAMQAMILSDAIRDIHIEENPQCHIIAMAKEQKAIALSVGSHVKQSNCTGMAAIYMTCEIPANRLSELVNLLNNAKSADAAVAKYASEDMERFSSLAQR